MHLYLIYHLKNSYPLLGIISSKSAYWSIHKTCNIQIVKMKFLKKLVKNLYSLMKLCFLCKFVWLVKCCLAGQIMVNPNTEFLGNWRLNLNGKTYDVRNEKCEKQIHILFSKWLFSLILNQLSMLYHTWYKIALNSNVGYTPSHIKHLKLLLWVSLLRFIF